MLLIRAQVVLQSHSGELQTQNHLREGLLDEIVDGSQNDDGRAVLTSPRSYVILELPPCASIAFAFLRYLKAKHVEDVRYSFISIVVASKLRDYEWNCILVVDEVSRPAIVGKDVIVDLKFVLREEEVSTGRVVTLL